MRSKDEWIRFLIKSLGPHLIDVQMIYNAREDGWKAKDFHKKCDRKGPTVSITKVKDGPCIGGFTTV